MSTDLSCPAWCGFSTAADIVFQLSHFAAHRRKTALSDHAVGFDGKWRLTKTNAEKKRWKTEKLQKNRRHLPKKPYFVTQNPENQIEATRQRAQTCNHFKSHLARWRSDIDGISLGNFFIRRTKPNYARDVDRTLRTKNLHTSARSNHSSHNGTADSIVGLGSESCFPWRRAFSKRCSNCTTRTHNTLLVGHSLVTHPKRHVCIHCMFTSSQQIFSRRPVLVSNATSSTNEDDGPIEVFTKKNGPGQNSVLLRKCASQRVVQEISMVCSKYRKDDQLYLVEDPRYPLEGKQRVGSTSSSNDCCRENVAACHVLWCKTMANKSTKWPNIPCWKACAGRIFFARGTFKCVL